MFAAMIQTPFTVAMWAAIVFGASTIYRGYAPGFLGLLPPAVNDGATYFGVAFIGLGVALAGWSWFRRELGFLRKITFPLGALTFSVGMGISNLQRLKDTGLLDMLST